MHNLVNLIYKAINNTHNMSLQSRVRSIRTNLNKEDRSYDVSVVIVNYYSENDIKELLTSIKNHNSLSNIEILIVSNSIFDPTYEEAFIADTAFNISIIQLQDNYGFAIANNEGSKIAKSNYLFFLNPDCRLLNDTISVLIDYIASGKKMILAPMTFDDSGKAVESTYEFKSLNWMFNRALPFIKKKKQKAEIDVINGHAIFINKKIFIELGMMNEDLFLYCEEDDLCKMAENLSIKRHLVEDAKLIHIQGTSTSNNLIQLTVERERSIKKYLIKHEPNLVQWNRILGVVAYLWRFVGSIIVRQNKIKFFYSIFAWYLFSYDENSKFAPNKTS